MKKKNGFTLIELLAVIIILGILMLVAIPSVTSYINNSRKNTFAETAANYIKGTIPLVNEAKKVSLYSETTLYMIPAGNDKAKSCVSLESGGASPYSSTYDFAYVGVTYDGNKGSYNYYFVARDGAGNGFRDKTTTSNLLVSNENLVSGGRDYIGQIDENTTLADAYANKGATEANGSTALTLTSAQATTAGLTLPSGVDKVQFVLYDTCK